MATTVLEELKTFFTADTSGLEKGVKTSRDAVRTSVDEEKRANDLKRKLLRSLQDERTLAPLKARVAEEREADKSKAKAEKDSKDAIARVKREADASKFSNVVKDLRANFGKNAKAKFAGGLQSTLGLSEDAANGLATKFGRVIPVVSAVALGVAAVAKVVHEVAKEVDASTERMKALNAEFLQSTRSGTFANAGDDPAALAARVKANEELRKKSRAADMERDPYGYGTGFLATVKTLGTKALQPLANQIEDPLGFDREASEKAEMNQGNRLSSKQDNKGQNLITEGLNRRLAVTKETLAGDRAEADILGLQLSKVKALADAKTAGITGKGNINIISRGFDLQIAAAREQQTMDTKRFALASSLAGVAAANVGEETKRARVLEMNLKFSKQELETTRFMTTERRRAVEVQVLGYEAELKQMRQAAGFRPGRSDVDVGGIRERFRKENLDRGFRDRYDARVKGNDGLIDIKRGLGGEITTGRDMLTGLIRGPSAGFKQSAGGLKDTLGGLITTGLGGPTMIGGIKPPDTSGGNDTDKGRTLIDAARATVDAIDISNRYLENISRQMDTMGLA